MLGFLPEGNNKKGWTFWMGKKSFSEEKIAFALRQNEPDTLGCCSDSEAQRLRPNLLTLAEVVC